MSHVPFPHPPTKESIAPFEGAMKAWHAAHGNVDYKGASATSLCKISKECHLSDPANVDKITK